MLHLFLFQFLTTQSNATSSLEGTISLFASSTPIMIAMAIIMVIVLATTLRGGGGGIAPLIALLIAGGVIFAVIVPLWDDVFDSMEGPAIVDSSQLVPIQEEYNPEITAEPEPFEEIDEYKTNFTYSLSTDDLNLEEI